MEPSVGKRVRARDARGDWYDAKIVAVDHAEEPAEVKVHYLGWNSATDEWIALADERILNEFDELPDRPRARRDAIGQKCS